MRSLIQKSLRRPDVLPVASIIAVWALMEVLVNPRGNFPLNDDWCYAKSVFNLLQKGRLEFIAIIPMTLVAQVLWGALFCKIFGMSFFALRLSTIALGLVGLIATYRLLRGISVPRGIAFIGCMVIALNPIYLELSNTFMTDVPFYAFSLLTLCFLADALRRDSNVGLAVGTLLACAAVLIRQLGVVIPIAFALAYLLKNGFRPRTIVRAFLPAAITFGALMGCQNWLRATNRLPLYYSLMTKEAVRFLSEGPGPVAASILQVIIVGLVFVGLFLLPVLILAGRRAASWVALGSFAILTGALIITGLWITIKTQPGDIIIDFGVGPATLKDVFFDRMPHIPMAPKAFWIVVSLAGAAGGGMLVQHLFGAIKTLANRKAKERGVIALVLLAGAGLLSQSMILSGFAYFDRYFLMLVPLCIALIMLNGPVVKPGRMPMAASAVVLLLYGIFSVGATHDYFSWNRARWDALHDLTQEQQIPTSMIDGGYEFNGWYNYQGPHQNWWREIYDDYTLSFGPMEGFEVVESYPFRRWMPPGEGEILVLGKTGL